MLLATPGPVIPDPGIPRGGASAGLSCPRFELRVSCWLFGPYREVMEMTWG